MSQVYWKEKQMNSALNIYINNANGSYSVILATHIMPTVYKVGHDKIILDRQRYYFFLYRFQREL